MDLDDHLGREGVHHRHADAVQSAGDLVAGAAELSAGVEDGHDDLQRIHRLALRVLLGRMRSRRDPAAVIGDGDLVRLVDPEIDAVARAVHRLVDGVVEDLADKVMQAAEIGRADVHAGTAADRLEAFEDLDVLGAVRRSGGGPALAIVGCVFPYRHQAFPARTRISYRRSKSSSE